MENKPGITISPEIIVYRDPSQADWTTSEFTISGLKKGVGIEDEERPLDKKVKGETRISAGIYEIDFTFSPKFSNTFFADQHGNLSDHKDERFNTPHLVLEVLHVPGFDKIRWHWGNSDDDTDGCYLVGYTFGKDAKGQTIVTNSRMKYKEIYPIIYNLFLKNKLAGVKTYVQYKDKEKIVA